MINLIINLLAFLVSILLLVTVHEFGHFWVARRLGIKVLKFSVGFGKPLWRWYGRDGTEYAIAILPLGGYVKLLDERDGGKIAEADRPKAFNRQSLFKRALVIIAGPGINVLFAIFAFWVMWMIGVDRVRPVVSEIIPNSIAAQSGLPAGSEITSVDGHPTTNWPKITIALIPWLGETGNLHITARSSPKARSESYILALDNWRMNDLQPDPLQSLGMVPYQPPIPPIIGKISSDSPAAAAGLKLGDRLVSINGVPVKGWSDIVQQVQAHPEQQVKLVVQRRHESQTVDVKLGKQLSQFQWVGYLGVEPQPIAWPEGMLYKLKFSPWGAFHEALQEVKILANFNFVVLAKMVTGDVSMRSLGGPISIYQTSSFAFKQGLVTYIGYLALLSLMLALVNILPIPGLDGGHLMFYVIEGIMRKPLSVALQVWIIRIGFFFLIALMVQATLNDLLRSFSF